MAKRIGLSMRVTNAADYVEPRDSIAQDWYSFLNVFAPELMWITVPNVGVDVKEYIQKWGIEGFILTGGNDIGQAPERDATENTILKYALDNECPILGICRGLQIIQHFLGGELSQCSREVHVAQYHEISFTDLAKRYKLKGKTRVNSYHTQAVAVNDLATHLEPFAVTKDGWAEGFYHTQHPIVAVMWHPEREVNCTKEDQSLFRKTFDI